MYVRRYVLLVAGKSVRVLAEANLFDVRKENLLLAVQQVEFVIGYTQPHFALHSLFVDLLEVVALQKTSWIDEI